MAMPSHLSSPRVDHGSKDDHSSRALQPHLDRFRDELLAEVQASLRELRDDLRKDALDREITFRKALSQRPKLEEVTAEVASLSRKLELSLQAIADHTNLLDQRCTRHEKALMEGRQHQHPSKSEDIIVATASPTSQGNIIRDDRVQELTYRFNSVKAKCDQTESALEHLVKRLNSITGGDDGVKDLLPLTAMADRVEFIQETMEQMNAHVVHERHEREHLSALMSRIVQQISRPSTPRACRLSNPLVRNFSEEPGRSNFTLRNYSEDPPARRIRIGITPSGASASAATSAPVTAHHPTCSTACGSPMTPHAPLAFQARSAAALASAMLVPGGSIGVVVQGSPVMRGGGSPGVPPHVASSPRSAPLPAKSVSTAPLHQGQTQHISRFTARGSAPSFAGREVLGGGPGAVLRTSSQPAMPGQSLQAQLAVVTVGSNQPVSARSPPASTRSPPTQMRPQPMHALPTNFIVKGKLGK